MVLAALSRATVRAAKYLIVPALVFAMWKNIVSPLTISILSAAFVGLAYTSLVKPGEELTTIEKVAVLVFGAFTGGFLQRSSTNIMGGW